MKRVFHKITAGFMALVVILSTMSFTINMHFCGDELIDTAIFSEAESCGMDMVNITNNDFTNVKDNCCNEQEFTFKGLQEINTSVEHFTLDKQLFLVAFVQSYVQLFDNNLKNSTTHKNYTTPLIVKEIHKLDEIYLI